MSNNEIENSDYKKKVIGQLGKSLIILALLVIVIIVLVIGVLNSNKPKGTSQTKDAPDVQEIVLSDEIIKGKALFKANCTACHSVNRKLIGPALAGVTNRHDLEWIYAYVKNNIALRNSGDAEAIRIYEEYNGSVMTIFPHFTNEDIDNILAYIKSKEKE